MDDTTEPDGPGGRVVPMPPRLVSAGPGAKPPAPAAEDAPDDAPRAAGEEEALRIKLELLRTEHRDLDHAIEALGAQGGDPFTIKRFKSQKLRLKDRIARIEDQITPDIIA